MTGWRLEASPADLVTGRRLEASPADLVTGWRLYRRRVNVGRMWIKAKRKKLLTCFVYVVKVRGLSKETRQAALLTRGDMMSENSKSQAKAQLSSVRDMVAALNCDYDRLEELREERQPFIAGWNMAGYMPDSEPCQFADFTDARDHIAEELRERAEQCREEAESHCETGDKIEEAEQLGRAARFEEAADNVETQTGAFSFTLDAWAFWVSDAPNGGLSEDDAAELAELEEAAGDCESQDDARQRIEEGALSVEIRSDWETVGARLSASEFRIVLCTGGPHVEIVGDLDRYGEPESARLLYQDWFEGKSELPLDSEERDDLLDYCRVFYFGE